MDTRADEKVKESKMKKTAFVLIFVIVTGGILSVNARADTGPKPSVVVSFSGLEGSRYYVTLLSSRSSTGPYSAGRTYEEYMGDYEVFQKFNEYTDIDGYYFLRFFGDCSENNRFNWTYYPPQEFKVLIYFPETDTFIVSYESYERYAFDSYFTAELTEQGSDLTVRPNVSLSKSYDFKDELISFVVRVIVTIAIELCIALLFNLREGEVFRIITTTNIITQIMMNLVLNLIGFYIGMTFIYVLFYVLLEIAVFAIEAIFYTLKLKKTQASKQRLVLYALSSNAASFALGMLLAQWIPGIF